MFIILGIVILIISFVVALVSLIREQGKDDLVDQPSVGKKGPPIPETSLQSDTASFGDVVARPISRHTPTPTAADLPVERPRGQGVQEPQSAMGVEGKSEGTFPWEDTNQKTIEQIKADLAKIAIEKGSAKAKQAVAEPAPSRPQATLLIPPEEAKPWPNEDSRAIGVQVDSGAGKNLTGEITLRNIPRGD